MPGTALLMKGTEDRRMPYSRTVRTALVPVKALDFKVASLLREHYRVEEQRYSTLFPFRIGCFSCFLACFSPFWYLIPLVNVIYRV